MADYTAGFHFSLPTLADRALTSPGSVTDTETETAVFQETETETDVGIQETEKNRKPKKKNRKYRKVGF